MSSNAPKPARRRGSAAEEARLLIDQAEADGVARAAMTLRMTLRDVSELKRDPKVPMADIAYGPDGIVRKVQSDGRISFMGRSVFISAAFARQPIALRATSTDGVFEVRYCAFTVASLDLREGSSDGHPTVHHVRVHPSTISAC